MRTGSSWRVPLILLVLLLLAPDHHPCHLLATGQSIATVSTAAEFQSAIASSVSILLACDIILDRTINFYAYAGVTVEGQNYKLDGGAVYRCMTMSGASVAFTNLVVTNCRVASDLDDFVNKGRGGYGAGLYMSSATVQMTNCIFMQNSGEAGAGIFMDGGSLTLTECEITDNDITQYGYGFGGAGGGAGLFANGGKVTMTGCLIARNAAGNGFG